MALVSISEAARLAGISRTNLYKYYLKRNKISLSKNQKGQPVIETSEILRVFGTLQDSSNQIAKGSRNKIQPNIANEDILFERIKGLEQLLKAREEELESYRQRETSFYRLLEDKTTRKKRWWPFRQGKV